MAVNVADLIATLRMDASQFTRTSQQVAQNTNRLRSGMEGFGKVVAAVFSVAAIRKIADWGQELYQIGVQSEAMGLRYQAVFGDMTQELDKWVVAHQESFGMAKDDVQGYVAQVANMLTPMGLAIDQAGDFATTVLEVANAWSIWSGGQYTVTDASSRVVKGLMGQTRGLVDMGMKITDSQIAEEMLRLGTDKLAGSERDLAEIQARLNLIVAASAPAFQVAETALDGAAGASRNLSGAWATLLDTLGGGAAGGAGQGIASVGAGILNTFSAMLGNPAGLEASWAGWMNHSDEAALAAEMADYFQGAVESMAANPLLIPDQVRNALIDQLYGTLSGAPNPEAVNNLFTSLAAAMPGQATELAGVFRSIIGDSLPEWTPPRAAMIRGAEVMAARLAAVYEPKMAEVGEKVVDWIASAAEREALRQEAVLAVAAQFDALPGLIAEREGDVRAAISDLFASMGSSAELQQTITQLTGAGYGGIAGMLLGAGDTAETRAAAAELGAALATAEGQAYLSTLEWEIEYANNKAAWAASASIAADSARWAGAGAAAAAAVAAGYDSYLAGHPLTPPSPGGGGVPTGGGGSGFVPENYTVNMGMVIGDDTQVAKAVDTALRRAKQRGG